ncbi:hypothetical protein VNO78_17697 [Psophocarpus tetragonolobus]|uniref:Uncharacterized protein n=1 Tax=Psophocarpus tetragonolobus TaxID=3891 RepID=A0AAN9XLF5_PSOTE
MPAGEIQFRELQGFPRIWILSGFSGVGSQARRLELELARMCSLGSVDERRERALMERYKFRHSLHDCCRLAQPPLGRRNRDPSRSTSSYMECLLGAACLIAEIDIRFNLRSLNRSLQLFSSIRRLIKNGNLKGICATLNKQLDIEVSNYVDEYEIWQEGSP